MFRTKYVAILVVIIAGMLSTNCTRTVEYIYQDVTLSDEYVTGYPVGNPGPYIQEMMESVMRITNTSYYTIYHFHPGDQIRPEDLHQYETLETISRGEASLQSSAAGTAVVIYNDRSRVGMLTSLHVVAGPDTTYQFYENHPEFLESVTVKDEEVNWLIDSHYMGTFEVLAFDVNADIAFIGTKLGFEGHRDEGLFPVFPYDFGSPEELTLGTFTYHFGFPRGYPMVTTGLVNDPNRDHHHSFITDALFNPGFSGGVVVAIRGGVPQFEWVGMARSASASREWLVVPDEDLADEHISEYPYKGELYIEERARIDYGITHIIPATRIQNFLDEHASTLRRQGYRVRF